MGNRRGLVIALVAAAVAAWPYVRRYAGSAPPPQFYDKVQLEPALARDYPRLLGSRTMRDRLPPMGPKG